MLALPTVRSDAAQCDKCSIRGGCKPERYVSGRGALDAELVVVGEAPMITEMVTDSPFTSTSGKLLWSELAHLKALPGNHHLPLARHQVYATNVLACTPLDGAKVRDRDVAACKPRLMEELAELNPRVILCLGATAATALRGRKSGIAALVGHTEWSEELQAHLAYTYSPAVLLSEPGMYQDFVWGLRKAVDALAYERGPRVYPPIDYVVAEDPLSALAWLDAALTEPLVTCDIETDGLRPGYDPILSIGFSWREDFALILPMRLIDEQPLVRERVHELLSRREGTRVVGHNYQFDVRHLRENGFTGAYVGGDTMLLHYALDERSGRDGGGAHDLKTLARKYCDAPSYAEGIDRGSLASIPPETMYRYQANDCIYTFRLNTELTRLLNQEEPSRHEYMMPLEMYERVLLPAANALANVEQRGILINARRLIELKREFEQRIDETRATIDGMLGDLRKLVPIPFNPNSTKQLARILYTPVADGGLGYPVPPPAKGQRKDAQSTSEEALHWLQRWEKVNKRPPHPLLDITLDYRSLIHTKATNIDGTIEHLLRDGTKDSRLRGHFHLPGTTSGRLSSSSPNLQNIPARSVIKEIFVARPGYTLVNADYRRLEVGVLAWYSRDPQLITDFLADDFHWNVAQKVFADVVADLNRSTGDTDALTRVANSYPVFNEIAQRQAKPTQRIADPADLYDKLKELLRRQAKYISFGKMYGEGAEALAAPEKGMGVPVEVAAKYSEMWDNTYPVAIEFLKRQVMEAKYDRWLETPTGRRRRFGYPRSIERHLANEAMNFPIQSFGSDMCLISLTKSERDLPAADLGYPLLTVHDSILFEVRENRLAEAQEMIHEIMTTTVTDPDLVFEIDMKVGRTWATAH